MKNKLENIKLFKRLYQRKINNICKKYKIKRMILYGSAVENLKKARDYDIAIGGYEKGNMFEIAAKLDRIFIDKECDIMNLDVLKEHKHPLYDIIEKTGVIIYEN